jgi:hypothetical protein
LRHTFYIIIFDTYFLQISMNARVRVRMAVPNTLIVPTGLVAIHASVNMDTMETGGPVVVCIVIKS